MQNYQMWIGGKWMDAESGQTIPVINPANGEAFASIPSGGKAEVDKAVEAARRAFPVWSEKTQAERSEIMFRIASGLKERAQELAELEVRDHGFPFDLAFGTIMGSISNFEYAAQAARLLMSDVLPMQNNCHIYLQREPIGVCALITPWNVPLNIVASKMAFTLAVGNTCVIKPASIDSLAPLKFAEILEKSGLPEGTVNFITGSGASVGEALASHPGVDIISFTGSSETGKAIMASASSTMKRILMELGGKNPFIVLEDADVDAVVGNAVMFATFNSGQVCAAPGRFYIHEKIYDEFVDKFVAIAKDIVVGDPTDKRTQMGPVVSAEHRDKIESYIKIGIEEGAKLLLGGERPTQPPLDKGYYVMPTVFANVTQNMRIAREEIFGPVACFLKFSSDEEVIQKANDTVYGLSATVWTKDTARGMRMANKIKAGSVFVNSTPPPSPEIPWGGFKESGIGKESSKVGLEEVTQLKVIGVHLG